MRIVVLANLDVGFYKFRGELMKRFINDGHEVVAVIPYGDMVPSIEKIGCEFIESKVDRRGMNPFHDLKLLGNYLKILRAEHPDVVITYTVKPNIYGGIACRMLGIRYVSNITGLGTAFNRGRLLEHIVVDMYGLALKQADTVFFENKSDQWKFINYSITTTNKACLLHGAGVNLQAYLPAVYPHEHERIRFLFIGRIMREKGVDELFAAMRQLLADKIACELTMIGAYEDGYKTIVETYQSEGWLHYYGFQTDVRPFIADCDCFVLPSWHEGMANTNLECAAMARPIITSNIAGCNEAVEDGENGYLCNAHDTQSLYTAMIRFVGLSLDERKQMGLKGRARMEHSFDREQVVEITAVRLYQCLAQPANNS